MSQGESKVLVKGREQSSFHRERAKFLLKGESKVLVIGTEQSSCHRERAKFLSFCQRWEVLISFEMAARSKTTNSNKPNLHRTGSGHGPDSGRIMWFFAEICFLCRKPVE